MQRVSDVAFTCCDRLWAYFDMAVSDLTRWKTARLLCTREDSQQITSFHVAKIAKVHLVLAVFSLNASDEHKSCRSHNCWQHEMRHWHLVVQTSGRFTASNLKRFSKNLAHVCINLSTLCSKTQQFIISSSSIMPTVYLKRDKWVYIISKVDDINVLRRIPAFIVNWIVRRRHSNAQRINHRKHFWPFRRIQSLSINSHRGLCN